jgi:hypothetical protein
MNEDSMVISDRWRTPITAQPQRDGGIALRSGRSGLLILSPAELQRLFKFANDLGVLQRFPMAPKGPHTDDLTPSG